MAKFIIILRLFLLYLLFTPLVSVALPVPVKMYAGASHFSWLYALREVPDHEKSWKSKEAASLPKSDLSISYPREQYPNKLLMDSSENNTRLRLVSETEFQLSSEKTGYFGIHHHNNGEEEQTFNVILTMNDGSTVNSEVKSAKKGNTNFAGFIVDQGKAIKQVDIDLPKGANLSVEQLQWGDLSDKTKTKSQQSGATEKPLLDQETELVSHQKEDIIPADRCNLSPEVVQYRCDNDQWLFDIKVSTHNPHSTWWCSDDKDEQCASYNKVVSYGYYPKLEKSQVQLLITDQDRLSCSQAITVKLPEHCENNCSYHYKDGQEIESCEVGGSLVTKTRKVPALSLVTKE